MKGEITVEYAIEKFMKLNDKKFLSEDEHQIYIEMVSFLAENHPDPQERPHYILCLGGTYYEQHRYDLALKYYEMAEGMGMMDACTCLGYIWYYGRTGTKDYEKAFYYFSQAAKQGDINSEYKLADMYKNGHYVKPDYEKYKEIIKNLYPKVKNANKLFELFPEIATRLAAIYVEEGRTEEAVNLYLDAKSFLSQRIVYNAFFGNFTIMKYLIRDLYKLIPLDEDEIDFYDLYEALRTPARVTFHYKRTSHTVRSLIEDGECVVEFEGKWFRSVEDFIEKAAIGEIPLYAICRDFYMFNLTKED